jgi:ABC-2 type transport system ATP-binding protein
VQAATLNLHFGSEEYQHKYDEIFRIGVYIEADEDIADYEVVLSYDDRYLSYLKGAEEGGDGTVKLSGTLNGKYKKYLISFQGKAGGDTSVAILNAKMNTTAVERIDVEAYPIAPVYLTPNPRAYLESIKIDGQGIDEFRSDDLSYDLKIPYTNSELSIEATGKGNVTASVLNTSLVVGENTIVVEAIGNGNARNLYKLNVYMEEQTEDDETGAEVQETERTESTEESIDESTEETVEESIEESTDESTEETVLTQSSVSDDAMALEDEQDTSTNKVVIFILLGSLILLFVFIICVAYLTEKRNQRRNRGEIENLEDSDRQSFQWDSLYDEDTRSEEAVRNDENSVEEQQFNIDEKPLVEMGTGEPVISIKNVTMRFKISTSDASGLKEFMIQKLKKKVTHRELLALNDISFDVYKGEVVGIIGTNGSGKSTLLRIVSGALNPTKGRVEVDRRKVQLLTLGTGFDMELTARENVYLNGAIIGYSKEFLDEHFDEIIEFAELWGFVDEKVKNFSSGMVSRLGFAIATAGDAAEILILDEVLSVGDEFFRKKSLKRVKEMIHGGSTVLMVSHSMETIISNCSKVVWIEKGVLQMVGDAKTVCEKYRTMNNE